METQKRPASANAIEQMFNAIAALRQDPFLQEDGPDKPPKQPCGETFKTKGRIHIEVDKPFGLETAILLIAQCYQNAYEKAKRFCKLLSEDGCNKVVFVKYDEFDSDVGKEGDKMFATVEMTVIWKCAKP